MPSFGGEIVYLNIKVKNMLKDKKDIHLETVGKFFRIAADYTEKFKIGGKQKLQKLIGEDLFYKKNNIWWWSNSKIISKSTLELKEIIKKIENAR